MLTVSTRGEPHRCKTKYVLNGRVVYPLATIDTLFRIFSFVRAVSLFLSCSMPFAVMNRVCIFAERATLTMEKGRFRVSS